MNRWSRLSPVKKGLIIFSVLILIVVIALGVWGAIHVKVAKAVVNSALDGKRSLEYAQVAIATQEFERAQKDLGEANAHFTNATVELDRLSELRWIPGVAPQMKAADQMLIAASNLSSGLQKLAVIGGDVTEVLSENGEDVSFGSIAPEDKARVLKVLSESTVDLQAVKSDMELAALAIEHIPDTGLIAPVREAVTPVKEQLPLLESMISQAIPLAQSLPYILGHEDEKKYLFLLQNNNELRPTGGFIGTYGILSVQEGEIREFYTDNIYNLDSPAAGRITEPSPVPIAQHTSTKNWLLRNINWDPHFPATAVKAQEKYDEEAQTIANFDGVIAVTPRFIASLLALTGPITVEGTQFTQENLQDTLQVKTEYSFASDGKTDATRKEIIGDLADQLIDELFSLPKSKLPDIWNTFVQNVDEKHILLYVEDPATQRLIVEENWAGEMKVYTGDYLAVIDANLAALKTDEVMKRTIHYSVQKEGGEYVGIAEMEYTNEAESISFFHTRYRTHSRFYLPYGAQLLEASGFETGDKIQNGKPTDPTVSSAAVTQADGTQTQFTVVEGFISIEPRETESIRIKYRLPDSIQRDIQQGEYSLLVQKQAGTNAHGLNLNLSFDKKPKSVRALDFEVNTTDNGVSLAGDLRVDRPVEVDLK